MILNEIIQLFGIGGISRISEIQGGHINNTFLAECEDGRKYILQSLNQNVFHDQKAVMENISKIERVFADFSGEAVGVPHFLCTEKGVNYAEYRNEIYRVYKFVEDIPNGQNKFYRAGFSFGTFIRLIGKRNIRLKQTVRSFHSYQTYFSALAAADKSSSFRKIDSIVMRRLDSLGNALEQVFTMDFPKCCVHNDAKISNVVFGEKCTIIDLDTASEGYAAIDYGDMIRSASGSEKLDFAAIHDVTEGFADGLEGILTDDEIYSLYYGILYVTGELAVRYLINYLSDEKYFKGKTSAACLSRANELLRQLNIFISGGDEITSIIYKPFKKQQSV
ncbi:MAG: aminoglycoside phosphotransferase family protein [Ruminococcus sp.]|nr:aminoglycoside phosphotransferase family protein [Ruminococcus sp.]